MEKAKIFTTSELPLAALLILNKFELLKFDKEKGGRATFYFQDRPERLGLVLDYFGKKTMVEPTSFLEQIRHLKGLINN